MNHRKIFILLSLLLTGGIVFGQLVIDKPAASVNLSKPEMISVKQLEAQVNMLNQLRVRSGLPAVAVKKSDKLEVLDKMISEMLISQAAADSGLKAEDNEVNETIQTQKTQLEQQNNAKISDQQFKSMIESQTGYSWDKYKSQIAEQIVLQKYIAREKQEEINASMTLPSSDDIEKLYNSEISSFVQSKTIRYSQVYISTLNLSGSELEAAEKKANDAYRKYVNGTATFEKIVNDYTEDQTSKYKNGDTGYITLNDPNARAYLGSGFMDALFSTPLGEVKGVIKSNIGFHIIKVTEYYKERLLGLDDPMHPSTKKTVRDYIAEKYIASMQNAALNKALESLVEELKKKAEITIYEENIN